MSDGKSVMPLIGLVLVILIGLAITYATVTGMLQLTGAAIVSSDTAFIVVAILFILTLPWAYRRAKQDS